jgi:hypothetical protein
MVDNVTGVQFALNFFTNLNLFPYCLPKYFNFPTVSNAALAKLLSRAFQINLPSGNPALFSLDTLEALLNNVQKSIGLANDIQK